MTSASNNYIAYSLANAGAGPAHSVQLVATSPASATFYTSTGTVSSVMAVSLKVDVAGTNGSDVTIQVYRVRAGVAIASGQAILTAALNLKATATTVQNGTLVSGSSASYLNMAAGDSLAYIITGTATSVQANLTVLTAVV